MANIKQRRVTSFENEKEEKLIELCKIIIECEDRKINSIDAFKIIKNLYKQECKLIRKIMGSPKEVVDANSIVQEIKKKIKKMM